MAADAGRLPVPRMRALVAASVPAMLYGVCAARLGLTAPLSQARRAALRVLLRARP